MSSIFYLSSVSREYYGTGAFTYITDPDQKKAIKDTATALGVSAATIAGAMTEENNDYWQKQTLNDLSDDYALSSADPSAVFADANIWGPVIALTTYFAQGLFGIGTRTHDQWVADYAAVGGDNGYAPSLMDKILHPVYMDLGYGNFKMSTAIRLVQKNAGTSGLGLEQYTNDYAKLAADLVDPASDVTAKLYGLMIKEADNWFTAHNAYGADWGTLPQEIKDALYVTYVNLGPAKMQTAFDATTTNGAPYEPLPAVGSGGGVNHLYNAYDIANAIGVTDYAGSGSGTNQLILVSDTSTWQQIAKQDTDQGEAYREALIKLRPFAVVDGSYDGGAGVRDDFSDQYLQDRTDMLALKMEFRNYGILPDNNILYKDAQSPLYYEDKTSKLSIVLGSIVGAKQIIFGGNGDDALNGDIQVDHLYGGAGNDTLSGGLGNDWLEGGLDNDILEGGKNDDTLLGGKGNDILNGGEGNDILNGGEGTDTYTFTDNYGTDVVTDSDGLGSITIAGQVLNSASQQTENIYKNDDSGYAFVKVNGGNNLIISKEGDANRIIINDWSDAKNLGISLQNATPTPPTATLTGDFKKKIDDHGTADTGDDSYVMSNGNYTADETAPDGEAGALDLITGTEGNDVIDGKGGSDALSGKAGDDYIEGGTEGDILQGGLGKDTLNGGAGDDAIYGSSDMDINKPTDVNFAQPVNDYLYPQATGFNWTKGYSTTWENGVPISSNNAPRNRLADDQGNIIDGGTGHDFIAAGTGADYVHGGADKDQIWGMDKDDILFGDGGNDFIYGDGNQQGNDTVVWSLPENHGNDIIDGGEGDDILVGQGGDDAIFGGNDNDKIWGDDYNSTELAPTYNGNDYIDGGQGNDTLIGGGKDDIILGGIGNDEIWGDDSEANLSITNHGNDHLYGGAGADTLIGGAGNDTLDGGAGADQLQGGAGDDVYLNVTGEDTLTDTEGHNIIQLAQANGLGGCPRTNMLIS